MGQWRLGAPPHRVVDSFSTPLNRSYDSTLCWIVIFGHVFACWFWARLCTPRLVHHITDLHSLSIPREVFWEGKWPPMRSWRLEVCSRLELYLRRPVRMVGHWSQGMIVVLLQKDNLSKSAIFWHSPIDERVLPLAHASTWIPLSAGLIITSTAYFRSTPSIESRLSFLTWARTRW